MANKNKQAQQRRNKKAIKHKRARAEKAAYAVARPKPFRDENGNTIKWEELKSQIRSTTTVFRTATNVVKAIESNVDILDERCTEVADNMKAVAANHVYMVGAVRKALSDLEKKRGVVAAKDKDLYDDHYYNFIDNIYDRVVAEDGINEKLSDLLSETASVVEEYGFDVALSGVTEEDFKKFEDEILLKNEKEEQDV